MNPIHRFGVLCFGIMIVTAPYVQSDSQRSDTDITQASSEAPYINSFDMEEFLQTHLPEYLITERYTQWYTEVLYALQYKGTGPELWVRLGLFPSVIDAEGAAEAYMDGSTQWFKEGPPAGVEIGDRSWFYPPVSEKRVKDVLFVRRNGFFVVHDISSGIDVVDLAKRIDNDLIAGAGYLIRGESVSCPVIQSVDVSKSAIREGETSILTVHAQDPNGAPLELHSHPSWRTQGNELTVTHSLVFYPDNPDWGVHPIKIWAINEQRNMFSKIFEVDINF